MAGGNNQFAQPGQGIKTGQGQIGQALGQAVQSLPAQMPGQMPSQFGQAFGGAGRFTQQFNPGVQRNTFTPQQYAAPNMSPGVVRPQAQSMPWNIRNPAADSGMQWMPGGQPGELMHDNGFTGVPQGQTSYGSGQGGFVYGPTPWNVGGTQQPQTNPGRDIGIFGRRGPWNEVA